MRSAYLLLTTHGKGVMVMSEEEQVKAIFAKYREWIEGSLSNAKATANDCDIDATLREFYYAVNSLKGLDGVFKVEISEVRQYIEQKRHDFFKKEIPEIAGIIRDRCILRKP